MNITEARAAFAKAEEMQREIDRTLPRRIEGLPPFHELMRLYKADLRSSQWRLGQWFYIVYDAKGRPFPELFHAVSTVEALKMIEHIYYEA